MVYMTLYNTWILVDTWIYFGELLMIRSRFFFSFLFTFYVINFSSPVLFIQCDSESWKTNSCSLFVTASKTLILLFEMIFRKSQVFYAGWCNSFLFYFNYYKICIFLYILENFWLKLFHVIVIFFIFICTHSLCIYFFVNFSYETFSFVLYVDNFNVNISS